VPFRRVKSNLDTIAKSQHITLEPYDGRRLAGLCGQLNEHLRHIERRFGVRISNRGNLFTVTGETKQMNDALSVISALYDQTAASENLTSEQIHLTIREQQMAVSEPEQGTENQQSPENKAAQPNASHEKGAKENDIEKSGNKETCIIRTGRTPIKPRGNTQKEYVDSIRLMDVNFGIGPAGTGKTFLAVACALEALDQGDVRKIILTRPAVEAGEKLGFLPGDMVEKINPYLRPLYDALYEMLGFERISKLLDRQIIEIAPLAYMRGRTLNHAFIILDEAQNTTPQQMKMLLTRLGFGSKAVITGDHTQIDLPHGTESGLRHAIRVLSKVSGLGFTFFQSQDVVRHAIVQAIVEAYDQEHTESNNSNKSRRNSRRKTLSGTIQEPQ